MLFDEEDSCGENSSSTLMDSFPNKGKGKMVGIPPKRKQNNSRVLDLGVGWRI